MTEGLSFFKDSLEAESMYYHRYESPEAELNDKAAECYDEDDYMSDPKRVRDILSRHYCYDYGSNGLSSQSNSMTNDEGLSEEDHNEMQMEVETESMMKRQCDYQLQETKKVQVVSSIDQSSEVVDAEKFNVNDAAEERDI